MKFAQFGGPPEGQIIKKNHSQSLASYSWGFMTSESERSLIFCSATHLEHFLKHDIFPRLIFPFSSKICSCELFWWTGYTIHTRSFLEIHPTQLESYEDPAESDKGSWLTHQSVRSDVDILNKIFALLLSNEIAFFTSPVQFRVDK